MMPRRAGEFNVVLHEHAIVEGGDASGPQELSGSVEARAVKDDVVDLPLARRSRGVHLRRKLAVNGRGLAVGISFTLIRVEHLHLINTVQEDAAVAAILILAFWGIWLGKFNVKLAIAEGVFGVELTSFRHDFEISVLHFPFRGAGVFVLPLGEIFAVEENGRVRRCMAGSFLRAGGSRLDHWWHRAIAMMDFVFGIDLSLR